MTQNSTYLLSTACVLSTLQTAMQFQWQRLPKNTACCLDYSLENGDNPTPCPALRSTHKRSSKGCRKVLGGRVGHCADMSLCGAGTLHPSPAWGPRAPDSERPSAGVVPPCHTQRRPHTPQLQEMVGVCDYKTRALFAFCQWTVHWSIMGRTTNRASENKRPYIIWESYVWKLTCPLSIASRHL